MIPHGAEFVLLLFVDDYFCTTIDEYPLQFCKVGSPTTPELSLSPITSHYSPLVVAPPLMCAPQISAVDSQKTV
jgi:hypothetical protein